MRFQRFLVTCLLSLIALPALANCQLGGSACGDPVAVSCNGGAVCFPPWRTCNNCTCTTTSAGQTCLANSAQPGTVATLSLSKHAGTSELDLAWSASCSPAGPDYAIYEGQAGDWVTHVPIRCTTGFALSLTIAPAGGDRYYLVAPVTTGYTGSLGKSSNGAERPAGDGSCTADRAIAPCP